MDMNTFDKEYIRCHECSLFKRKEWAFFAKHGDKVLYFCSGDCLVYYLDNYWKTHKKPRGLEIG